MRVTYTCARCHNKVTGQQYRAPGKHLMGRVLMEEYVCLDCLNNHAATLESGFWGSVGRPQHGVCASCPCKLEHGGSFHVHRYLKEDGTWEMARVCDECFGEYKSLCTKVAEGNRK